MIAEGAGGESGGQAVGTALASGEAVRESHVVDASRNSQQVASADLFIVAHVTSECSLYLKQF